MIHIDPLQGSFKFRSNTIDEIFYFKNVDINVSKQAYKSVSSLQLNKNSK